MKRLILEASEDQVLALLPSVMGSFARVLIEDVPVELIPAAPLQLASPKASREEVVAQPPKSGNRRINDQGKRPEDIIRATLAGGAFIRQDKVVQDLKANGFAGSYSSIHRLVQNGTVESRKDARNTVSLRLSPKG